MRFLTILFILVPGTLWCETFLTQLLPQSVTVYPHGAEVVRKGMVRLPKGLHEIVIPDLRPMEGDLQFPVVHISGAILTSQRWQNKSPTQPFEPESEAYLAAKENLEAAKAALGVVEQEIETNLAAIKAAHSQIEFLKSLAKNANLSGDVNVLRDLSRMIVDETHNDFSIIQQAEIHIRKLREELPEFEKAVEQAERDLKEFLPPSDDFAQLSLTVDVREDGMSELTLTYLVYDAGWSAAYDLHLSNAEQAKLQVHRGALVHQNTGENWRDVDLTLSTVSLISRTNPIPVMPHLYQVFNKDDGVYLPSAVRSKQPADSGLLETAILAEDTGVTPRVETDIAGGDVAYQFDIPITINSNQDVYRLNLDTLAFEAEIEARAIAMANDTAFRMVKITNTSQERLLAAKANLYLDGHFLGETYFPQVIPEAEIELGFGPIHGLRLNRSILKRNNQDQGYINQKRRQSQSVRIDIENHTAQDWTISLLDRIPYSEQEELSIDYTATPPPSVENYNDQRGILQWNLDIPSGQSAKVSLKSTITWPDEMQLRK